MDYQRRILSYYSKVHIIHVLKCRKDRFGEEIVKVMALKCEDFFYCRKYMHLLDLLKHHLIEKNIKSLLTFQKK